MKQYKVYKFPSYLGTPKTFNSLFVASLYRWFVDIKITNVTELEISEDGEPIEYHNCFGGKTKLRRF